MKYTTSKQADKKIQEDIEVIKKIILSYWKPRAIIMFGGFGHGGGSFKKIKNKIVPLNDYDLYIITENFISALKSFFETKETITLTSPFSVNLTALLIRFDSICSRRNLSPVRISGISS